MPFPRGTEPEKAVFGYMQALQGLPIEPIATGIRKFLRGECEGVSTKFCPHPPELATIVRNCIETPRRKGTGKLWHYQAPKSRILKRNITKGASAALVASGAVPRGSIWCPGDFLESPEFGDLFAPDDDWPGPVPFEPNEKRAAA